MAHFPSKKYLRGLAGTAIFALLLFFTAPALMAQSADTKNRTSHDSLRSVLRYRTHGAGQYSLWRLPGRPEYPYRATDSRMREIIRFLHRYPELRDAVIREYLQEGISDWENRYVYSGVPVYEPIPFLESEARRDMARYGVPYDPLRPWTLRSSVDARTLLE